MILAQLGYRPHPFAQFLPTNRRCTCAANSLVPVSQAADSRHVSKPYQYVRLKRASSSSVLLGDAVVGADLVAESVVLVGKTLALLLHSLKLAVLLPQSLLELRNLAELASVAKARLALLALGVTNSKALVLLLKTEDFEDHGVGAVEDEGKEQSEAAQVHVALGVELAGLDLHALATGDGATLLSVNCQSILRRSSSIPSRTALLLGHGKLDLHPVDAVDAVNKQDENEDKCDLRDVSA